MEEFLTSEIFGFSMFSAPMSREIDVQLKFFGLASTVFQGGVVLFCQVYTANYLQTFETMASLGFIFNAMAILINVVSKSVYKYKMSVYKDRTEINKLRSSTQVLELSERQEEPPKTELVDENPVVE